MLIPSVAALDPVTCRRLSPPTPPQTPVHNTVSHSDHSKRKEKVVAHSEKKLFGKSTEGINFGLFSNLIYVGDPTSHQSAGSCCPQLARAADGHFHHRPVPLCNPRRSVVWILDPISP